MKAVLGALRKERYDVILTISVAVVVLSAFGADVLSSISGLIGLVLIVGTLIESSQHRPRWIWVLLAAVAAAVAVEIGLVSAPDAVVGPIALTLLGGAAAAVVTRQVLSRPFAGTTSIAASACAYLLIGYAFAALYLVIDRVGGAPFLNSGEALTPESAVYFSFVTLTTLGFGDLTPSADGGRVIVTLEAMAGVFYVAIAVARLVTGFTAPASGSASTPAATPAPASGVAPAPGAEPSSAGEAVGEGMPNTDSKRQL